MRFFLWLCLFLLAAPWAQAEDKEVSKTLPEVLVKGDGETSLTVPGAASAKKALSRAAGGTAFVNAEDYKKGSVSTLKDSLGYTPGVFVQPRFGSEEARLSVRGSGIQRTFHLRGIKLLQDGIPINQADGGGDFQAIDPLALQYIEVFRGANALQYGGTTLGGAVNFVTPTGRDASLAQGRFEIGSFNYLREQVSSGAAAGPFDYYVSLSESRQDGFRNHAEQWNRRVFSNYGLRLGDNAETRFYVNLMDSKSMLPGALTQAQMHQNPKQNAPASAAGNQKRDFDLIQLANKTVFKWEDDVLELASFYARKDLFHPIFQVLDIVSNDFGASARAILESEILDRRNTFTIGFSPVWGIVDDTRHVNAGGERGARTAESRQHSYNLDLYGENQFYVFEKLAAVAGLQWSYASRKSRDQFLADGNNSGHPTYIGLSPKAGLRYDLTEHSQLFTNFSRSFEPPSFGELVNRAGGGLFDLTEQKAKTVEIGARGEEGRFSWDLAWYYAWVENELLSLNDAQGNPLGTVNAYGTRHQGVEFGGAVEVLRGMIERGKEEQDRVVLRSLYNWSRFRFKDDPAFSDNPLPGIPAHFIRTELVYEHPFGVYAGPNLEWTPVDYAVDMNHTLFTEPYAVLGLKAGYRTKKGFSFFIEAKNLTDKNYAATTGVIADARGRDSAQFFPGEGRSVAGGVEFRWD